MKILAENIFKSFPVEFCLAFIKTDGNSTQHPKFGTNELTHKQFKYSSGLYKQKLYKNIIECLNLEIKHVQEGLVGDMSEPLVGGAYIKMLYKYNVSGSHDLNRRLKYPELMEIVDELELEKKWLSPKDVAAKINAMTKNVESKMPYKNLFIWECLGYEP